MIMYMTLWTTLTTKLFGDPNTKVVNSFQPLVEQINQLEDRYQAMTDNELQNQTPQLKERLKNGETLDQILPEAFALVREASKRVLK